jgi:hypothetical protein
MTYIEFVTGEHGFRKIRKIPAPVRLLPGLDRQPGVPVLTPGRWLGLGECLRNLMLQCTIFRS